MINHPSMGLVDIFAATIPELDFKPSIHMNYAETVLPIDDELPKYLNLPVEFGGTGERAE